MIDACNSGLEGSKGYFTILNTYFYTDRKAKPLYLGMAQHHFCKGLNH